MKLGQFICCIGTARQRRLYIYIYRESEGREREGELDNHTLTLNTKIEKEIQRRG